MFIICKIFKTPKLYEKGKHLVFIFHLIFLFAGSCMCPLIPLLTHIQLVVLLGHPPPHAGQHSYPVLVTRRGGQGRRLPPTPNKPSTLKLQSTNINFPKLNASPTRVSLKSSETRGNVFYNLRQF